MKKTKDSITYITSKTELWFLGLAWEFQLAGERLLQLLAEKGIKTIGHAFSQRNVSAEPFSQFLTEGRTKVTFDETAKADLTKLKENIEHSMRFVNASLQVRVRKAQTQLAIVAKKEQESVQTLPIEPMQIALFEQQPIDTTSEAYLYYSSLRTPSGELLSSEIVEKLVRFQFSPGVKKRTINYGIAA